MTSSAASLAPLFVSGSSNHPFLVFFTPTLFVSTIYSSCIYPCIYIYIRKTVQLTQKRIVCNIIFAVTFFIHPLNHFIKIYFHVKRKNKLCFFTLLVKYKKMKKIISIVIMNRDIFLNK